MEVTEPDVGDPFCLPAIAAATRELWRTLSSPPSIVDFLPCVKKHQKRIEAVFKELDDILDAADWADDLLDYDPEDEVPF